MIAKWANPACRVPFNHHIEGTFFRIHPTEVEAFKIPGRRGREERKMDAIRPPNCGRAP
jgi:hypothetical protein